MERRMIVLVVSATALALCACAQLSVPAYAGHLPLITQSRRCDETGISPDSVELRLWLSIGPSTLKSLPRLDATVRILSDSGTLVREFQHVARPGLRVILAPQRVQLRITQAGTASDERPTLVLERGCTTDVTVVLNGQPATSRVPLSNSSLSTAEWHIGEARLRRTHTSDG